MDGPAAKHPARSPEELLHELQVHQIELEMQNEAMRQTQISLENSRDRYAELFEFAPIGYFTLSNTGLIAACNLAGATLLGMTRSKLVSRRFAKFVAAEDSDRWYQLFLSVLNTTDKPSEVLLLQRGDGSQFPARLDCRYVKDDSDGGTVLLTLIDTGERRSLRQREQSFNAIFEHSPIGIGVAGPDRRYRQVNPAFCRMLGYSEAELLGMSYLDITHPDDQELTIANPAMLRADGGRHFSMEKRYVTKTGTTLWVSLNAVAVTDETNGELLYSIGLAEDITARREAEIERLAHARQQRDTLVREVHHRIKNNLQSVAGLLQRELGKFTGLNPRLETAISQINAIAIVHGLQGSGPDEATRLCDNVQSICKTVSELLQRPVMFRIEHEQTSFLPVGINSDESVPIALVLNELILNAVKHAPVGGAATHVSLSADGVRAKLSIRNGWTTAPEFDFETGQGLGTGLRLVRSLMPLQGARLSFEQDTAGQILTHLELTSPIVMPHGQKR